MLLWTSTRPVHRQNLLILCQGLFEPAAAGQDIAHVDQGIHVPRVDFQGLPIIGQRLVEPTPAGQRQAQAVVRHRVVGLEFQGLSITGYRAAQRPRSAMMLPKLT